MKRKKGVIFVEEDNLPRAWEKAVVRTWNEGRKIPTEYDKPNDLNSRDVTATIVVRKPFNEPRIHKAFPGDLESLEKYRQEVVFGVHNHWVKPEEGKWSYTYHQRLFEYDIFDESGRKITINQMDYVLDKLAQVPHTRRAQAIIWKPEVDTKVDDPACLQRLWFRVFGDELQLNVHIRSNDAFKAAFMNMWAFSGLQKMVANALSLKLNKAIIPGSYVHIADSFHIYGSYFEDFKKFLETLEKRKFKNRTWNSGEDFVQEAFANAKLEMLNENVENEKELLFPHQLRLYQELPDDLRKKVDERVRKKIGV